MHLTSILHPIISKWGAKSKLSLGKVDKIIILQLIEHKNMGLLGKDLLTNFVKYKTPVTCVPCTGKRISFVNQEKVDARPETCSSRCLWSSNKKDSNSKTTFSQAIHYSPPSRSSLSTQVIFLFCMIQSITLILWEIKQHFIGT